MQSLLASIHFKVPLWIWTDSVRCNDVNYLKIVHFQARRLETEWHWNDVHFQSHLSTTSSHWALICERTPPFVHHTGPSWSIFHSILLVLSLLLFFLRRLLVADSQQGLCLIFHLQIVTRTKERGAATLTHLSKHKTRNTKENDGNRTGRKRTEARGFQVRPQVHRAERQ